MELFTQTDNRESPLAYRMRPRNIDEFIGQDHIAGPGKLLRRIIQADRMSSIIFYGPPGTGKTTLAQVIANTTSSNFITMNAVLDGVKNLRDAVAEAQKYMDLYDRRTILFVDEVHRWNKSQQDALLPWVENGTVILIGATTENPYFEVNKALVSRSRIFQLKPLTEKNLRDIAIQAAKDPARGYGRYNVEITEEALSHLIKVSGGDARSLLNALELAVETTPASFPPPEGENIRIDLHTAEESIQRKAVLYDKEGDYHFDTISAFIKSIRGSDPDAALYWLATMVKAGEDPRYIFRRLLISASEDIGLADPQALGVVESAAAAFDRVGLPEGRFHLAQAVLYLATAPKSNSTLGFFDALDSIANEQSKEVPNHLKDAGRDNEGFGHGEGYLYPHAYRDHWVAQQYLPSGLQGRIFYQPGAQGFEVNIKKEVEKRREIQLSAAIQPEHEEVLTFSPPDRGQERWLRQVSSNTGATLTRIRNSVFRDLTVRRHDCILVLEARPPFILWEAVRQTPEGGVWYYPANRKAAETAEHSSMSIPEINRPQSLNPGGQDISLQQAIKDEVVYKQLPDGLLFDKIIASDIFTKEPEKGLLFKKLSGMLKPDGGLTLYQILPSEAQLLSGTIELSELKETHTGLMEALKTAEEIIYKNPDNPLVNWTGEDIIQAADNAGLRTKADIETITEKRVIPAGVVDRWFSESGSGYGKALAGLISDDEFNLLKKLISEKLVNKTVDWKMKFLRLEANF